MKNCLQTQNQSVYQHGISVRDHMFELIYYLESNIISNNWKLPQWIITYRTDLLKNLLSKDLIEEYTIFHDCSKPYCLYIDENGNRHFPNHAQLSGELWYKISGNKDVANLMSMDMDIHKLKSEQILEFASRPEAITLLLAGLAEIHSNSQMFGGIDSTSFKIKYKHIDKRGRAICKILYGDKNDIG